MDPKEHWENIYTTKDHTQVSWYAAHVSSTLDLFTDAQLDKDSRIIDVGGGASTLADDLLDKGYGNLSVLDISSTALDIARTRLGDRADQVRWMVGDLLNYDFGTYEFDVWHDRAVLHFLTLADDRKRYLDQLNARLTHGGFAILSVFADDGPIKCSGIEIVRSSESDLEDFLGAGFKTLFTKRTIHGTPGGVEQKFVHLVSQKS
ncbi:MAG: class I SAM-dependent methyltransferase [Fibrobacteria bacterium]